MIYVAQEGTWDDAGELVLIDTTEWTNDDYLKLDEASDMERSDIAKEIAQLRTGEYKVVKYGQLWEVKDGVIQNG